MVMVLTVATEAGMWDGPGHGPLLPRPTLILQAVLSQADRVPPVMRRISFGTQASRLPAPSSLRPLPLEAWSPALSFPR